MTEQETVPAAPFSWFVGAGLAAIGYYFAMRGHPSLAVDGVKDVRRSEGALLEDLDETSGNVNRDGS